MSSLVNKKHKVASFDTKSSVESMLGEVFHLGDWVWVKQDEPQGLVQNNEDGMCLELACIKKIESNLIVLSNGDRVLNTELVDRLEYIADQTTADAHIKANIVACQDGINTTQEKINSTLKSIQAENTYDESSFDDEPSASNALSLYSDESLKSHEKQLKKLRENTLPDLHRKLSSQCSHLSDLGRMFTYPITAGISEQETSIAKIDEKLHEVDLYAGLSEEFTMIQTGAVASESEKINIFQHIRYMDEESLLLGNVNKFSTRNIEDFNQWLLRPENLNKLLSTPKCIVGFKPRRYSNHLFSLFENIENSKTYLYFRNGENIGYVKCAIEAINNKIIASDFTNDAMRVSQHRNKFHFVTERQYQDSKLEYELIKAKQNERHVKQEQALIAWYDHPNIKAYREARQARWEEVQQKWAEIKKAPDDIAFSPENRMYNCYSAESIYWLIERYKIRKKDVFEYSKTRPSKDYELDVSSHSMGKYHSMDAIWLAKHHDSNRKFDNFDTIQELGFIDADGNEIELPSVPKRPDVVEKECISFPEQGYQPFNDTYRYYDDAKKAFHLNFKKQNDIALIIQGIFDRAEIYGRKRINMLSDDFFKHCAIIKDYDTAIYDGEPPSFDEYIKNNRSEFKVGDICFGHKEIYYDEHWQEIDSRENATTYRKPSIEPPLFLQVIKLTKSKGIPSVKLSWWVEKDRYSYGDYFDYKKKHFICPIDKLINITAHRKGDYIPFFKDPRTRENYATWGYYLLNAEKYDASRIQRQIDIDVQAVNRNKKPIGLIDL